MFPNRYMCSVLAEMRTQTEALNHFSMYRYKKIMTMMIEEVQTMGNRMEAGLEDAQDVEKMMKERSQLNKDIKKLRAEKEELSDKDTDKDEVKTSTSQTLSELMEEIREDD